MKVGRVDELAATIIKRAVAGDPALRVVYSKFERELNVAARRWFGPKTTAGEVGKLAVKIVQTLGEIKK